MTSSEIISWPLFLHSHRRPFTTFHMSISCAYDNYSYINHYNQWSSPRRLKVSLILAIRDHAGQYKEGQIAREKEIERDHQNKLYAHDEWAAQK